MSDAHDTTALLAADAPLPDWAERLREALLAEFGGTVDVERTGTRNRCRFGILSRKFEEIADLDRQDAAWDVAQRTLNRDELIDVSLILTYAPSDFNDED